MGSQFLLVLCLLLLRPTLPSSCPESSPLTPSSIHPLHDPLIAPPTLPSIYSTHPSTLIINHHEYNLPSPIHSAAAIGDANGDGFDDVVVVDTVGDVWVIVDPGEEQQGRVRQRVRKNVSKVGNVETLGGDERPPADPRPPVLGDDDEFVQVDEEGDEGDEGAPPGASIHVFSSPTLVQLTGSSSSLTLLVSYTDIHTDVSTYLIYNFRSKVARRVTLPGVTYTQTTYLPNRHYLATTTGVVVCYDNDLELLYSRENLGPILDPVVIVDQKVFVTHDETVTVLSLTLTSVYARSLDDPITSPITPITVNSSPVLAFTTTTPDLCVHLHLLKAPTGISLPNSPTQLACDHGAGIVPRLTPLTPLPATSTLTPSLRAHTPFESDAIAGDTLLLVPIANKLITVSTGEKRCVTATSLTSPSLSPVLLTRESVTRPSVTVFTRDDVITFRTSIDDDYTPVMAIGGGSSNVYGGEISATMTVLNQLDDYEGRVRVVGRRVSLVVTVDTVISQDLRMAITDGTGGKEVLYEGVVARGHSYIKVMPKGGGRVINMVVTVTNERGDVRVQNEVEVYFNVDVGGIVEGVIVAVVVALVGAVGWKAGSLRPESGRESS